jgi:CDP-glycerol glycerophosphotransferase (TagB/SpsB family)
VTGHPKFDLLYNKDENVKSSVWKGDAKGRKIIMVQMHFPEKEGNPHMPEPFIDEYLDFFKKAESYSELFFVIRPHPKFYETYEKYGYGEKVKEMQDVIAAGENLYLDQEKDYMNTLICADCYIGDRSSLMIEAAVLGIPVLYMTNFYYKEQMLPFVEELVESFYQGETCYDIEQFIDLVILKGQDYKKEIRNAAAAECVPYFDGQCGKRIVDAMAKVITIESET